MHQEDITDTVLSRYSDTNSVLTEYTVGLMPISSHQSLDASLPTIAINRLDRLTSGLLIIPLNADLARSLTSEFMNGSVRKEYVARCKGEFPVCVPSLNIYNNMLSGWFYSGKKLCVRNHC